MTSERRPADTQLAAEYGIDPEMLRALPEGTFTLVNLFRLREHADDDGAGSPRSGLAAMMRYASVSGRCLEAAGGRFLTRGLPVGQLWGDDDERWDIVVVAEYPSGDALRNLLADPAYRAAFADRRAAVEAQRVLVSVSVDA